MCKYCEKTDNEGRLYSVLASGYPNESKNKGFRIVLHKNELNDIVNGKEVRSHEGKMKSYIKAYHWEFGKLESADHVAVEIKYCPFCGQEL